MDKCFTIGMKRKQPKENFVAGAGADKKRMDQDVAEILINNCNNNNNYNDQQIEDNDFLIMKNIIKN